MKQPISRFAVFCFVILFALASCTRMNMANTFCPRIGVNACEEQPEEPESEVIMRVENPTGVVFI